MMIDGLTDLHRCKCPSPLPYLSPSYFFALIFSHEPCLSIVDLLHIGVCMQRFHCNGTELVQFHVGFVYHSMLSVWSCWKFLSSIWGSLHRKIQCRRKDKASSGQLTFAMSFCTPIPPLQYPIYTFSQKIWVLSRAKSIVHKVWNIKSISFDLLWLVHTSSF